MDSQLDGIFYPQSVAVVGATATPGKIGFMLMASLLEGGYPGQVYPVNPGQPALFGRPAYPSLSAIPGPVDLAIISIPAALTIPVVKEAIAKEVKGIILVSGGFSEVGTDTGRNMQAELRELAKSSRTIIIGPNTLGVANPMFNFNGTFQTTFKLLKPGKVAVVAQSGGMCTHIVHALTDHNVGISKCMSLGNRVGLDFNEVIEYLGQDEETGVIALYIEGLDHPRDLLAAARVVVKKKPVVALKSGRGAGLEHATLSHTGALAGSYRIYQAAFKQNGIIMADTVTALIDYLKALSYQPPAPGNRVAIISVQAGPGIVTADQCREKGLALAQFSPETKSLLRQKISLLNSVDNPVDAAWVSTQPGDCREVLDAVLADPGVDAVIVASVFLEANMGLMWALTETTDCKKKPVVVCLDSPGMIAQKEIMALENRGFPVFSLPDRVVTGLAGLVRYGEIVRA
jgi:acyl-CoA synthetase (NDP forming)